MGRPKKYPDELIARGVRLALESERPIAHIAADLGIHSETLRKRVRQAEADSGARPELTSSSEREELKRLRRENYELRRDAMPDAAPGRDVPVATVDDMSSWPSLERVILPTRALLTSWVVQTLPMRHAALADSVAQARALADEPPGAGRDLAVLAVVSDAMQPLEDLAYLATSWSEPLHGVAYYVRATMYSDRTPTNFWGRAHKRDDAFLDVLAGFASRQPDTAKIVDVLDTFEPVAGAVPDDAASAAMELAREATRSRLRMLLPILGEGWKQFSGYFYAYKHGGLVVNRSDARWWSEASDGGKPVEREQPALTAWLRGGKALEGRGEFRLGAEQIIREADGRGRMAIEFTDAFVRSRLALFDALVFNEDGSIRGLQPMRLAWTAWLKEAELPPETWAVLGAGPTITWREAEPGDPSSQVTTAEDGVVAEAANPDSPRGQQRHRNA